MSHKEKHADSATAMDYHTVGGRRRKTAIINLLKPDDGDRVPTDEEVSKLLEEVKGARPRSVSSLGTK